MFLLFMFGTISINFYLHYTTLINTYQESIFTTSPVCSSQCCSTHFRVPCILTRLYTCNTYSIYTIDVAISVTVVRQPSITSCPCIYHTFTTSSLRDKLYHSIYMSSLHLLLNYPFPHNMSRRLVGWLVLWCLTPLSTICQSGKIGTVTHSTQWRI